MLAHLKRPLPSYRQKQLTIAPVYATMEDVPYVGCWHIMFPPSYSCLLDANLQVLGIISSKKCFFFRALSKWKCNVQVYDDDIINNHIIFFFFCCNMTRTLNKEITDSAETKYCSIFQCVCVTSQLFLNYLMIQIIKPYIF